MTARRPPTAEDWAFAAMLLGAGILAGAVLAMMVGLLVGGLWILVLILLPLFLIQLVAEGLFWALASGIRRLWRRLRGLPPPEPEPRPERDPTIPLVRAWGFPAGLAAGAASTALFVGPDLWSLT